MVPSPHARFASPNFMNAFHKCHPFCFWVPFLSRLTEFLIIPQNPEEMILHSFNNYLSTANVPGNLARYWEDGMNETHFLPSWTFHPLWSIPWLAKKAISVLPWDSVMSVSFPPWGKRPKPWCSLACALLGIKVDWVWILVLCLLVVCTFLSSLLHLNRDNNSQQPALAKYLQLRSFQIGSSLETK